MYEQSLTRGASEVTCRSTCDDCHREDLRQGADRQQDHRVDVAHRLDQGGADGEEGARQEGQEDPVPSGTIAIGLAVVGKLLGIVISRVDAVVGRRGLDAELHDDSRD